MLILGLSSSHHFYLLTDSNCGTEQKAKITLLPHLITIRESAQRQADIRFARRVFLQQNQSCSNNDPA